MKVAVVVRGLPAEQGGGYTFSESVVAALRELEREVPHEFVYYSESPTDEPGVRVIPQPEPPPAEHPEPGLRRLAWAVRENLSPSPPPPPPPPPWFETSLEREGVQLVWFADISGLRCTLPYIFTVLDIEHLRQPWFPENSVDSAWERRQEFYLRQIPRATRVIVPNEAGREQVLRNFTIDGERILTLPHPAPEFAVRAGERDSLARETVDARGIRDPYLFYPAQFWAHKNHITVLDALAELNRDSDPGFDLVLVGSDKEHGQLNHVKATARELGVTDRVHFLGFVDRDELVALYQHAFALTYMSLFGPENLPPLEAMALGCPVIGADIPGAAEQLGSAALRVPPLDAGALAAAVRRLGDQSVRSDLVDQGRARVREWSARDYVNGVLSFVDEFERLRRLWP